MVTVVAALAFLLAASSAIADKPVQRPKGLDEITLAGTVGAKDPDPQGELGTQAALGTAASTPLGTSFTYQGQLKQNGNPVNGKCDFQFGLFDAAGHGNQVGATQTVLDVTVTNGLFTVQLNSANEFGNNAFTGEARWLLIYVRCPAGSGDYTYLTPRQPVTAAPYALGLRAGTVISGTAYQNLKVMSNAPTGYIPAAVTGEMLTAKDGVGVYGSHENTAADAGGAGVWGRTWSPQGAGIEGTGINGAYGVKGTSDTGTGVYGYSTSGTAIQAAGTGIINSTADSVLYLSPHSMVNRGSANVTLTPQENGGMLIRGVAGGEDKYLSIPVSTFGTLFGAPIYVKAVEVCFAAGLTGKIRATAVTKNDGSTGYTHYIYEVADHIETSRWCYTLNATTPRQAIDSSTWVQLNVAFWYPPIQDPTVTIYSVKLTLTEKQSG